MQPVCFHEGLTTAKKLTHRHADTHLCVCVSNIQQNQELCPALCHTAMHTPHISLHIPDKQMNAEVSMLVYKTNNRVSMKISTKMKVAQLSLLTGIVV